MVALTSAVVGANAVVMLAEKLVDVLVVKTEGQADISSIPRVIPEPSKEIAILTCSPSQFEFSIGLTITEKYFQNPGSISCGKTGRDATTASVVSRSCKLTDELIKIRAG